MTATDRLRAMLDEHEVKYDVDDTQVDDNGTMYRVTYVKEGYGRTWVYEEPPDCDLLVSYNHDLGAEQAIAATLGAGQAADEWGEGFRAGCDAANGASEESVEHYKAENAELREQMERLVTLLRNDCDIDASWDGLRKFWSIGLTEGGCLMRDRACKAEAENAKLRELCKDMMAFVEDDDACERCGHDAECVEAADGELVLPYEGRCLMLDLFADRMRDLGIEVGE